MQKLKIKSKSMK